MRKSSSNASSRHGPSGHPGRSQRRVRPASTEQKSLSMSDRESRGRRSDEIEMTSGPTSSEWYTPPSSPLIDSGITGLGNRFAALPPTVLAPGTPEELSQSLQFNLTSRCEQRRPNSPLVDKSSTTKTSSFMTTSTEDRVLAPPLIVFPCTNKQSSSKVPIVSLPTPHALSETQESKYPSTFTPAIPPNESDNPPPPGLSPLHLQNGLQGALPTSASAVSDSEAKSPLLSPSLPEILSPEAQRRLYPQPLHPSFPTSSPMTSTPHHHKPVAHRRLTPYPARKDATEIRRNFPATDPSAFMSSNGKIVSIAAEIAAAQHQLVTEQELAERKKFGNAARFGRPRPPISRKGSKKVDAEEGRGDQGGSSEDEDEKEEDWEMVGKNASG